MTNTTSAAPSDAEISALAEETRTGEPGRDGYILPISFARAVLAKWGQPTPPAVVEPREIMEMINTMISSINEAHYAKDAVWKQGCFDAADSAYMQIRAMLSAHGIGICVKKGESNGLPT